MQNIFKEFCDILGKRFDANVYTTEDSVRYCFFYAIMVNVNLQPIDIVLEYPLDEFGKCKIDTYFPDFNGRSLAMEFKYDRSIPSGSNLPRPQKAGKLFADFFRLKRFQESQNVLRLCVYLTGKEMDNYFSNDKNNLKEFYCLNYSTTLSINTKFMDNKARTFKRNAGNVTPLGLKNLYSRNLPNEHRLKIFEII